MKYKKLLDEITNLLNSNRINESRYLEWHQKVLDVINQSKLDDIITSPIQVNNTPNKLIKMMHWI